MSEAQYMLNRAKELLEAVDMTISLEPVDSMDEDNLKLINAQLNLSAYYSQLAYRYADVEKTQAEVQKLTSAPTTDKVES